MNTNSSLRQPLPRLRLEDFDDIEPALAAAPDPEEEARIYRAMAFRLLRRYVYLSVATGRLPSILGGECARSSLGASSHPGFEDAVIFVHDVESCLDRIDPGSRRLLAMRVLEDYTEEETARLLRRRVRTIRRLLVDGLDLLVVQLLSAGLLPSWACQEQDPVEIS